MTAVLAGLFLLSLTLLLPGEGVPVAAAPDGRTAVAAGQVDLEPPGEAEPESNPSGRGQMPEPILAADPSLPLIPCRFLDARGFDWMLAQQDHTETPAWRTRHPLGGKAAAPVPKARPMGLVVPHHDVAAPMTARVLSEAAAAYGELPAEAQPDVIVLLGPNHERVGTSRIQTFAGDWETTEGIMPLAGDGHSLLLRTFGAAGEASLMEREHALSYLVPWVHHFFPEAEILPVLIHGNLDGKGCAALANTLSAYADARSVLFVASVDFSHGLSPEAALVSDATTWRHLVAGNMDAIRKLDNRYLDAPPTLVTLMEVMAARNADGPCLVGHAEASLFLDRPLADTTSYLSVSYHAPATSSGR